MRSEGINAEIGDIETEEHAELAIYNYAHSIAEGRPIHQVLQVIGIANIGGPCPQCIEAIPDVVIFFLGKIL